MTTFNVIHGLSLPGSNGQKSIERTPEGRAFGAVPERCALHTMRSEFIEENPISIRNRAVPGETRGYDYATPEIAYVDFPNGAEGFDARGADASNFITFRGTEDINPNAWTAFFILYQPDGAKYDRQLLLSPVDEEEAGVVAPHIALSHDLTSFVLYENSLLSGGQPIRVQTYIPTETRDQPLNIMVTFSVELGISTYINGSLQDTVPDDNRPLDHNFKGDEYRFFRRTNGTLGTAGVYNLDLSAPENVGYRKAIDAYAADHYGVPSL